MAAVGHLKFSNFRVYVTWPLSPCYSGSLCKMSLKSDNWLLSYDQNRFLKWRPSAILYFKNFHIWSLNHLTVTKYAFVYQISSKSDNLVYKTCKKIVTLHNCMLLTTFRCPSDILITSCLLCTGLHQLNESIQHRMMFCWDIAMIFRFAKWRPSAILNFRDPVMGSMKSPCRSSDKS